MAMARWRSSFRRLALSSALLAAAIAGCDEDNAPANLDVTLTPQSFPVLPGQLYYELWAQDTNGAVLSSLGQFRVNAAGEVTSTLEDGPPELGPAQDFDPRQTARVTVSVETVGNQGRGPNLLAGDVTFDGTMAQVALSTQHPLAIGVDLTGAAGSFILASPSDPSGDNETNGIWFADPVGQPALQLPRLPAASGWTYSGYVFADGHSIALGRFAEPDSADDDGTGPEGWPGGNGFNTPGSDFVVFGMDLAAGGVTAFISVEPTSFNDGGHRAGIRAAASLHDASFPFHLLESAIPAATPARSARPLAAQALPTAVVAMSF